MNKEKKIKLFLGSGYLLIVLVFLWIFFNNFSIQDFSSYELIKANRDTLEQLKNRNIFISCVIYLFGTIIWVHYGLRRYGIYGFFIFKRSESSMDAVA